MIQITPQMRILVAVEPVDFRNPPVQLATAMFAGPTRHAAEGRRGGGEVPALPP